MRSTYSSTYSHIYTMLSIIALFALWQAGSYWISDQLLPSPVTVLERLLDEIAANTLFYHTGVTLLRVIISFSIAMAIGITIGLLMGSNNKLNLLLDPWLLFFLK